MNTEIINNKTINALIVDDEIASRSLLREMLKLYCPDIHLVGDANQISVAKEFFETHQIDLIFLDIEMPFGNGFELLKDLHGQNFEVIFITGFEQYAIDAIKMNAMDYLLKPLDEDEFKEAVEKAVKRIQSKKSQSQLDHIIQEVNQPTSLQSISLHTREKIIFIRINEIYYLKAEGANTFYYLTSGKRVLSTKPLGKNVDLLPIAQNNHTHGFYRSHSSYAVNIFYAKEFDKKEQSLVLEDGSHVPVSQSKKDLLLKLIA